MTTKITVMRTPLINREILMKQRHVSEAVTAADLSKNDDSDGSAIKEETKGSKEQHRLHSEVSNPSYAQR